LAPAERGRRPELSARVAATYFLEQAHTRGLRLDTFSSTAAFLTLEPRDRGLANELVHGVLRNLKLLDFFIERLSKKPVDRLDVPVLWILRVGLYELEFLSTPARAAVHEAAGLTRGFRKASAAGFVNALLRRFLRERPEPPAGSSAQALSIRYSHPEWLVDRYLARYGEAATESLLRRNNTPPLPTVRVNRFKTDIGTLSRALRDEGIPSEEIRGLPDCLIVRAPAFALHPLYQRGHCFFMDPASQEVAGLADVSSARTLADFCAAPGGKSFILASRQKPDAVIHCCDISAPRLFDMKRRAALFEARGMTFSVADLTRAAPFRVAFDFALVDVPCTGLGTIRSNPDIRWKIQAPELARFHQRQLAIVRNAFLTLRSGATMIYATCSTEPEENEQVVEEFLASEPLARVSRPYFRTFPEEHPGDCFFAAEVRHL